MERSLAEALQCIWILRADHRAPSCSPGVPDLQCVAAGHVVLTPPASPGFLPMRSAPVHLLYLWRSARPALQFAGFLAFLRKIQCGAAHKSRQNGKQYHGATVISTLAVQFLFAEKEVIGGRRPIRMASHWRWSSPVRLGAPAVHTLFFQRKNTMVCAVRLVLWPVAIEFLL